MLDDPGLDPSTIMAALKAHYALRVVSVTFLPLGFDPGAAVYDVLATGGTRYFLKVRFGASDETGLRVSRALIDRGVPNRQNASYRFCRGIALPQRTRGYNAHIRIYRTFRTLGTISSSRAGTSNYSTRILLCS